MADCIDECLRRYCSIAEQSRLDAKKMMRVAMKMTMKETTTVKLSKNLFYVQK